MGELKGIVQFTGNFNGLSFYKSRNGKIIVRKTGGFKDKPIKTHANYARTRENASEFGRCARAGKVFRIALRSYLKPMNISYVHNKVLKLFREVLVFDSTSGRGNRGVGVGLQTEEGKALFVGYEFDVDCKVSTLFPVGYEVLLSNGQIVFPNIDSSIVVFPKGATHVVVEFGLVRMDFSGLFATKLVSDMLVIEKGSSVASSMLTVAVPEGDGVLIGLLHVGFKQEVDGISYNLKDAGLRVVACL